METVDMTQETDRPSARAHAQILTLLRGMEEGGLARSDAIVMALMTIASIGAQLVESVDLLRETVEKGVVRDAK
jgi:hypothetical protein